MRGLGNEVYLANRSTFLRVFDSDMARKVTEQLEEDGIHMLENTVIKSVEKKGDKQFSLQLTTKVRGKEVTESLEVNTILMAIGRDPNP